MPKTVINGLQILDVRDTDPKCGWYVRCENEDHQDFYAYFSTLRDAKSFCLQNVNEREWSVPGCVDCKELN